MIKFNYLQSRGWTPLEVRIWLSALIVTITLVVLVATDLVGPWALLVASAIVMGFGLMRYRAETKQAKRNADDRASEQGCDPAYCGRCDVVGNSAEGGWE